MAALAKLDRIDRRILAKLQADGRITNQALAEQVALSPSACLARIRRLEKAGVIEGYGARLNPWSMEASLILYAEISLKGHHPDDLARFERGIADIPEIVEASYVSGPFDYLIKVVVPDMASWIALSEGVIVRDLGVDKVITHVLMKKTKRFTGYPIPEA
ncbi:MAG TPA: winged helix-turn-helix transcriptional regulator [Brevundimonas sp.]|nr:winged helix-turn-helix transcriptional regulator [Brevundimonas sp.]